MHLLAIDPGTTESAYVELDGYRLDGFGKIANEQMLRLIENWPGERVTLEMVQSYGMAVGAEVFETVWWTGRFAQAAQPRDVYRVFRKDIKLHHCGTPRAKDANIRQALIDRYGGSQEVKRRKCQACNGRGRATIRDGGEKCILCDDGYVVGSLYGVSNDVWAALAVGVYFSDTTNGRHANHVRS